MIRIVIADDHAIVREGLARLIASSADFELAGQASNGSEVIARVRELDFDVLVLDMSMPGRSGIELIKMVKSEKPKLRVLVLSMHQEEQYAVRAIKAGASGYIMKDTATEQLINAIRKVAAGGAVISPAAAELFALAATRDGDGPPHKSLSDREFQVFEMLARGQSVSDIARQLNLSVKTVSTHKSRIMEKMNLANHTELIRYAISQHLIDDPEAPA